MSFITPEQVRAIRMKGSNVVKLEELDKEIRVIKMSSGGALEAAEITELVKVGKKTNRDVLLFLISNACADLEGNLISYDDAVVLFNVLPMASLSKLIDEVNKLMGGSPLTPALLSVKG